MSCTQGVDTSKVVTALFYPDHPEYKTSSYKNLQNPATINVDQMKFYHDSLGFSHFKIVGREYNPVQLAEIYTYYMVKPEHQAEVMSWAIYHFSNVVR